MQSSPIRAERRQVTILFSDIVGSSALSHRLDPEDLRDLIRLYQKTCTAEIERFGGTVSRYLGDGILALFGYPHAHDDDSERAINAGLAVVDEIAALNTNVDAREPIRLAVRVGIATGLVVAGHLIGEAVSVETSVVGETPNLAARIQQLAKSNTVVVHDSTRELAGTRFEYSDLGLQHLSGFEELVRVWQVLGRRPVRSRFEAAHPANLTPLIGRESNLLALLERWHLATQGNGQVVLLTGEAGIGKSRIAQALDERLEKNEHELVRFQCSSYHVQSALHPFIEQLEWSAKLATSDAPSEKLDKLELLVASSGLQDRIAVPLLALFLSIPDEGRYPVEGMSPQQRKERVLGVLLDRLRSLSAKKTLLVIFEDLHWADPTSLEFLQRIFDAVQFARILVVATFRPEFKPPWNPAPHISEMVLERLTPQQATDLAASVIEERVLPPSVIQQIVAKTDGVPLFIEEVTRAIHGYQSMDDLPQAGARLTVPPTIRDTLAARLDQLGSAKEFAQLGATIGRSFSYTLLAAAAETPIDVLDDGLNRLVGSGLLYQEGELPNATYSFKHALVQDAAYESLLRSERRKLHGRIADVLTAQFPEFSANQPEVVAHHDFEAGRFLESARYWFVAGKAAIERSANIEAAARLRRALGALERISNLTDIAKLELPIQLNLGVALTATEGFASPSVEAAYARARVLCDAAGDAPELFYALCGLGSFYTVRGNLNAAQEVAERMLELGGSTENAELLVWGHVAMGVTQLNLGQLQSARTHLEKGIAVYSPDRHRHHAFVCGQDAGIIGRCHLAWATWLTGDPDGALRQMAVAIELSKELSHAFSHAYALTFAAWLAQFMGSLEDCGRLADAAIANAKEQGFPLLLGMALVVKGWTISAAGDVGTGLKTVRDAISLYQSTGAELGMPAMLAVLSIATAQSGDVADGLKTAVQALELTDRHHEHLFKAELHRLIAELSLEAAARLPKSAHSQMRKQAKQAAMLAMVTASSQRAHTLMLRAALTSLRVAKTPKDRAHALSALTDVCNHFDTDSSLSELQQARRIISQAIS